MFYEIITDLYFHWLNKNNARLQAICAGSTAVPAWEFRDALVKRIICLYFFLRLKDFHWRQYRQLLAAKDPEEAISTMWLACLWGYRSIEDYHFHQWLQKKELSKLPPLPQGGPVLALPEGREFKLAKDIERIEKEATSGCGLYYELYEPRVLRALRSFRDRLCPYDLEIFNRINPWDLSDEAYAASCRAESEVWAEIRSDCGCDDE